MDYGIYSLIYVWVTWGTGVDVEFGIHQLYKLIHVIYPGARSHIWFVKAEEVRDIVVEIFKT